MTEQEFWNTIQNKMGNEILKNYIKRTFAPHIAEPMCNAIDSKEKAELLDKLHKEWLEYQKRQNDVIQAYLKMKGL